MVSLAEFMGGCVAPEGDGGVTTDFQAFVRGGRCININSLSSSSHAIAMPHTAGLKSGGPYFWIANADATNTIDIEYPTSNNLLTQPEDFSHADWDLEGGDAPTVSTNTTVAPDGTTTADTITFGAAGSTSYLKQDVTIDQTEPHIGSVFAQNLESTPRDIVISTGHGDTVVTIPADSAWHLVMVTPVLGATDEFRIGKVQGHAAFDMALWGAQLTESTWYQDYIPVSYAGAIATVGTTSVREVVLADAPFDGVAGRWLASGDRTFSSGGTLS